MCARMTNLASVDHLAMPYSWKADELFQYTREDAVSFLNIYSEDDARAFLTYQHRENQQARLEKLEPLRNGLRSRYSRNPLYGNSIDYETIDEHQLLVATMTAARVMRLALRFLENAKYLEDEKNRKLFESQVKAVEVDWKSQRDLPPDSPICGLPESHWLLPDLYDLASDDYLYCIADRRLLHLYMPTSAYTDLLQVCCKDAFLYDDSFSLYGFEVISAKQDLMRVRRELPVSFKKCNIARLDLPFGGVFESLENGAEKYVYWYDYNDIVTSLFAIHLQGIRTVLGEFSHVEERFYQNGLSFLWWHVVDMQRSGRVFKCKACGKICITTSNRGSERSFCSKACRLWAHRNPGKTRSPRR